MVDKLRIFMQKRNITPRQLVIGVAILVLILIGAVFLLTRKNTIDVADDEDLPYYQNHARLVDSETLFTSIGGKIAYEQLGRDMFVFAKTHYSSYKKEGSVVGFKFSKKSISTSDNKVSFSGKYGSDSGTVIGTIELLKNDRIKTTLTDKNKSISSDNTLPSNSPSNQFIATLPILTSSYDILYSPDIEDESGSSIIRVDIKSYNPVVKQQAIDFLGTKLDKSMVTDTYIRLYFATPSPDGLGTEYAPTFITPIGTPSTSLDT